jgi:SulP family sulfate permease
VTESSRAKKIAQDLRAGLVHGLVSVPDGLASGLLAGLSPITGLYGYMFGMVAGALATSSVLMSIQGTGAMAVIIADVPEIHRGENTAGALAMLGILTGIIMLTLGLLKLGSLVRFVPHAVLTGFISAVALNIILSQLADFTGFISTAPNRLLRAFATLLNIDQFNWPTVILGTATIVLISLLEKTPLKSFGLFAAIVVTSALAQLPFFNTVRLVQDVAEIPQGLPLPVLPSITAAPALLIPAMSLALVGLIQGAAISQTVPQPDGSYPSVSGDFRGQGVANIVSAFFRGIPVGGSLSGTAVLSAAGARSRLGNIFAGAVMAIVVLLFSILAGYIAMPALAGLLILVGARMFKPEQAWTVVKTGPSQAVVVAITFFLTLIIPLQYSVLVGVGISVILFVVGRANKVKVVRWVATDSHLPLEEAPPAVLSPADVVVLHVYGSLFFGSAATFVEQLPVADDNSRGASVIIRLRGADDLGSTVIQALLRYKSELEAAHCYLLISGVGEELMRQLVSTGAIGELDRTRVFSATKVVGESLAAAIEHARELAKRAGGSP